MKLNPKLIEFFKKHNLYEFEMFSYFEKHSTMLDSDYPDEMMFRTCAHQIDARTGILKGIHLNLPYVKNEETMLDSIHELTHAIFAYPQIGKKFKKDITIETLSLLFEKLYILENPSEKLIAYYKHLNSTITENDKEYYYGDKMSDELLNNYDYNPKHTIKNLKKLSKKYQWN